MPIPPPPGQMESLSAQAHELPAGDRQATGAALVKPGRTLADHHPFRTIYDPSHPAADARLCELPNVSDGRSGRRREAERSYEANLATLNQARTMFAKTLDILKAEHMIPIAPSRPHRRSLRPMATAAEPAVPPTSARWWPRPPIPRCKPCSTRTGRRCRRQRNGDVQQVVQALSDAELTMQTVVAVRDKVLGAYNDIMKMTI